jgi:glucokinase
MKIVVGAGTGLGVGILCKTEEDNLYQPMPSEGGHVDFTVQDQEDFDLLMFAKEFIETSDNIENLRAKGKTSRISVERLCAGPSIPLLYGFMKKRYPDLESTLE